MKIGILSDTHDNLNAIRSALEEFRRAGVSLILHAGDFIAPFTIPFYLESDWDFRGVFGNNDGDKVLLLKRSGGKIYTAPHVFEQDGKRIILNHYPDAVESMAKGHGADVVIYGHTHEPDVRRLDGCLIINPGECGGWTTGNSTVVILDLDVMTATTCTLP